MMPNRRHIVKDDNAAAGHSTSRTSPVAPLIFRAKWWRLAPIPFVVFFPLLLAIAFSSISSANENWLVILLGACFLGALLLLPVAWLAFYTIELTESGVRKHIPLIETREIPYTKIRHIKVKVMILRGKAIERVYLLWITDIRGARLVCEMKMFRRSDLAAIVDALAARAPQARIDQAARTLQSGQFAYGN